MKIAILLLVATCASAQTIVNQTDGPPPNAWEKVYGYSGSDLIYICQALSVVTSGIRSTTSVSISAVSKANPGVVTSTAHGFAISVRPKVTISGATGTGWVSGANTINGTFTATVIDADTFSIPVDTSGNGTLAGTVIFTTTAPRSAMPEWSVQKFAYTAGALIWSGWLNGTSANTSKCSEAAGSTVQQQ